MAKDIRKLISEYQAIYYVEDTAMIRLICALVLSNRIQGDPVWAMFVGGSSSGKTELLNMVTGLTHNPDKSVKGTQDEGFVTEISMLTSNTFLSGMRASKNGDPSLLLRIPRTSVLVMKDFTTILSMNKDEQQAIMGQFREVYDGKMSKATGNGNNINWEGKVTLIAGVTEKIHVMESKFSGMGTRAIQYTLPPQDSIKTAKRSAKIRHGIKESREHMKKEFKEYINFMIPTVVSSNYEVPEVISEKLLYVADFASLVRSPVERNFKGEVEYVLSREMPMRMSNQLHTLGSVFMAMEAGVLIEEDEKILYKIGLDSMPKGRRLVLQVLAVTGSSKTKEVSVAIGYETETTRKWLEELAVLGVCKREVNTSGSRGDNWILKKEYRDIMSMYDVLDKEAVMEALQENECEIDSYNEAEDDAWSNVFDKVTPANETPKNGTF
jgi:energy-coupling factor transporter ATP-binding protein EcfA2